jgi:ABC-2 type transport system permease protein
MKTIIKKELAYYFNSPMGYIVLALFAVFSNVLFIKDVFVSQAASMKPFFLLSSWIMTVFVAALSMRSFAQERQQNTLETLLTLPILERDLVLGKWLAILIVVAVGLMLTMGFPIALLLMIQGYWGFVPEVLVGYLGLMVYGGLLAAIGVAYSAVSRNQIVAFLLAAITSFALYAFSSDFLAPFLPRNITDLIVPFTPVYHMDSFIKGIIDLRAILYFGSATGGLLWFVLQVVKKRA